MLFRSRAGTQLKKGAGRDDHGHSPLYLQAQDEMITDKIRDGYKQMTGKEFFVAVSPGENSAGGDGS